MIAALVLLGNKTELIKERMKPGPGTKRWDKIFFVLYIPAYLALVIVPSLDAGRFGWSPKFPPIIYILSYLIFTASYLLVLWAMYVNKFFSSVVRIQKERQHKVIERGLYHFIRHPGYAATIPIFFCTSLILGSLWGLTAAGFISILILIRTYLEDNLLKKDLPGYMKYARKVKYRILPGVW